MKWRCNSCGGAYVDVQEDGSAYFHVCPTEVITHFGNVTADGSVTGQKTARLAGRDERPIDGLTFFDGKFYAEVSLPEDPQRKILTETKYAIRSEGKGRTALG